MVKVVQLRAKARAMEDASLWIARLDKGLSSDERDELHTWLGEQAENRKAFFELASLWDELDRLSELSALFPLDQSAAPTKARRVGGAAWALAAAGVACAAVALWLGIRSEPEPAPAERAPVVAQQAEQRFATPVGGHATEVLADGTVLTLNTDTEVEIMYSAATRDVYLHRGEAHFVVAHDAAHPFRVHVGERIVEAVGTAFNVNLRDDGEIQVTVTEGTVRVARDADVALPARIDVRAEQVRPFEAMLVEGEIAILDERTLLGQAAVPQIQRLEPVDMDVKLAWQRGMLIFRGEPLQAMLDEVARYTTTEFVLEDASLASVRVAGYFRAGDIDGLLLALRDNFRIDSEILDDDRIVLRQRADR